MLPDSVSRVLSLEVFHYGDSIVTVGQIVQLPLLLLLLWLIISRVGKLIKRALIARHVSQDAVHLFGRVYLIVTLLILAFTLMEVLNIPLTAFAFVSGAIAIGVGFGAQNIINNFISGWILMWEKPIRIGDFLEVGEARGVVETINTRSTRIRRNDGVHMLVPNSQLLENTVTNWTLIDGTTRSSVRVGVAYGSDVERVAKLMREALAMQPSILNEPEANVIFADFGDSALVFDAVFWMNARTESSVRQVRSDLRFAIYRLFNEHDIVIAFPQRDLHIGGHLTFTKQK